MAIVTILIFRVKNSWSDEKSILDIRWSSHMSKITDKRLSGI